MSNRNNLNRLGGPTPEDSGSAAIAPEQSSTMQYAVPTDIVDLPSKGQFYAEGHPLFGKDSVEIRHMTAKDEDILTNKSLIKKGIVLDRLLESIIVDKNIDTKSLLVCDKSALLVSARISAYGQDYAVKIPCISCGSVLEYDFDLEEAIKVNDFEETLNLIDNATLTQNGTFLITLPKTKAQVEFRPLDGLDESKVSNTNATRIKNNLPELGVTDQIKVFLVSVDGNEDKRFISDFVDNMPAADSLYLRSKYNTVIPNFELAQNWSCRDCGYEQVMEVPFTSDFFWPKR